MEVGNKIGRIKQDVFDFYCYSAKTFLSAGFIIIAEIFSSDRESFPLKAFSELTSGNWGRNGMSTLVG